MSIGSRAPASGPALFVSWCKARAFLGRQWLEYELRQAATVSSAAVYWFADQGTKLPRSWRLLYKKGGEWKPVTVDGTYGIEPDRYNKVAFAPVRAEAMRLEVELEPGANSGVEEWQVQ